MEQVSWNDAQEFIERLNRQEGANKYRLPTEAEWEYAARADAEGTVYLPVEYVWTKNNSGNMTHPVGQKYPNAWGLYDTIGNVAEWCRDWKGNYPAGPVTDPMGPASGSDRIYRGGSWLDSPFYVSRNEGSPDYKSNFIGFRLVRTP